MQIMADMIRDIIEQDGYVTVISFKERVGLGRKRAIQILEAYDVFVLDMGESVKIIDLAHKMIELSGLTLLDESNPEGDIAIEVTGLRPGEKLYEELLIGDNPMPTDNARIMKAHEDFLRWPELHEALLKLMRAVEANDVPAIRACMKTLVPGYQPDSDVVDWVWLEQQLQSKA